MADFFVRPLNGNDAASGNSHLTAWKTLPYALANSGVGSQPVRINVCDEARADQTATLTWGISFPSPTQENPLTLAGYTAAAGDGGRGTIRQTTVNIGLLSGVTFTRLYDLTLEFTGWGPALNGGNILIADNVIFDGLADAGNNQRVGGLGWVCRLTNCLIRNSRNTFASGPVLYGTGDVSLIGCRFENVGNGPSVTGSIVGCVVKLSGVDPAGSGIRVTGLAAGNSVWSPGTGGVGIMQDPYLTTTQREQQLSRQAMVVGNLVQGFSGMGGAGIVSDNLVVGNACFNNLAGYADPAAAPFVTTIDAARRVGNLDTADLEALGVTALFRDPLIGDFGLHPSAVGRVPDWPLWLGVEDGSGRAAGAVQPEASAGLPWPLLRRLTGIADRGGLALQRAV